MLDRVMALGWFIVAQAPSPTTDSAAASAGPVKLTRMLIDDGGWTMYVLLALSFVAVCMTIYFFLTIRMGLLMPTGFRREAESIAAQGDAEALHQACQANGSAGARVIGAAAQLLYDNPRAEYLIVRDVIEGEGSRQSSNLWQRIQYIMDIAVVAPMVGLLGTVLGMIEAFVGLKDNFLGATPAALATGVSKALITTASGLVVGITCMLLYSYFRGRVNRQVTRLEETCGSILQRFLFAQHARRTPPDAGAADKQPKPAATKPGPPAAGS